MQNNRRPSKQVVSALARSVKKYGVTFMGEYLYCSRSLILSLITGEHNPTSGSSEIINQWYLHRKNDPKAYRIWCQYKSELKRLAVIKREIAKWIKNTDVVRNAFGEWEHEIYRNLEKARKEAQSRMWDKMLKLKGM